MNGIVQPDVCSSVCFLFLPLYLFHQIILSDVSTKQKCSMILKALKGSHLQIAVRADISRRSILYGWCIEACMCMCVRVCGVNMKGCLS